MTKLNLSSLKLIYKSKVLFKKKRNNKIITNTLSINIKTKINILDIIKENIEVKSIDLCKLVGKSKSITQSCVMDLIKEKKLIRIKKPIGYHNTNVYFIRISE